MMRTATSAFLAFCAFLLLEIPLVLDVGAQERPRLVPSGVKAAMTASFVQDGKAVDIKIANPSDEWVILQAEAVIRYPDNDPEYQQCLNLRQREIAQDRGTNSVLFGYACSLETTLPLKLVIQPKAMGSAYIEVGESRTVRGVSLGEVRGREATFVERSRAKLR